MELLREIKEPFIFEKGFFTDKRFFLVDFYLPAPRRVCLEIDGPIHDTMISYDWMRSNYIMRTRKIKKILRITNDTALAMKALELKELIS